VRIFLFLIFFSLLSFSLFSENKESGLTLDISKQKIVQDKTEENKQKNNKLLIINFSNNSINNENDYIKEIILDSIKEKIFETGLFEYKYSDNTNDLSITDIYKESLKNNFDYVLSGYYFEKDNKIIINYKFYDLIKNQIFYLKESVYDSNRKILNFIEDNNKEIFDEISKKIKYHSDFEKIVAKNSLSLRYNTFNESRLLLFIKTGIQYSGLGFINRDYDDSLTSNFNNRSGKNTYENFFAPFFNFEIYWKKKSSSYGFGFNAIIPVNLNQPNFMQYIRINLSYNWAVYNDYFFMFGLYFNSISFNKYPEGDWYNNWDYQVKVRYYSYGLNFNFRYMPEKYPFYIEAGIGLQLPCRPQLNSEDMLKSFIIDLNMTKNQSWSFPVSVELGGGYFITKEVGLFLNSYFYVLSIDYNTNLQYSNYNPSFKYDKDKNLGVDLGLGYNIIFGMCIKSLVK
jgi:hypothetical protein